MGESKQIIYYNEDGKLVPKEQATRYQITRFDDKGEFIGEEIGRLLPPNIQRQLRARGLPIPSPE